jgi:hypothetical protein
MTRLARELQLMTMWRPARMAQRPPTRFDRHPLLGMERKPSRSMRARRYWKGSSWLLAVTLLCPTGATAATRSINVGSVTATPGSFVTFAVTLTGASVAGTQNDIVFDSTNTPIAKKANGSPDCTAAPALNKNVSFAFLPSGCVGTTCSAVRAVVASMQNTAAIPSGATLYTCKIRVVPTATVGNHLLVNSHASSCTAAGAKLSVTTPNSGQVTVTALIAQSTASPPAAAVSGGPPPPPPPPPPPGPGCGIGFEIALILPLLFALRGVSRACRGWRGAGVIALACLAPLVLGRAESFGAYCPGQIDCGRICCDADYPNCGQNECCPAGYPIDCGSGCCPSGSTCGHPGRCCWDSTPIDCGSQCCPSGGTCTADGRCCPPGYPTDCGAGQGCCPSGGGCADGLCCPASAPNYCGHNHCCPNGSACTPNCCPTETPTDCGDHCCGPGDTCTSDGCCPANTPVACGSGSSGYCCPAGNVCTQGGCCPAAYPVGCPIPGVCCPAGTECLRCDNGETLCSDTPGGCPRPPGLGACCTRDGTCSLNTADECNALQGGFGGEGSNCGTTPCTALGACCERKGCDDNVTREECESILCGSWYGSSSTCSQFGASCGSVFVNNPLPCDCNKDGEVTVDEIIKAVNIDLGNAALSTCPAADYHRNGGVTVDELIACVNASLGSCPPPR